MAGLLAERNKRLFSFSSLPSRPPDSVEVMHDYRMSGLPIPGNGSGIGNVSWANNLTKLVWTIESSF